MKLETFRTRGGDIVVRGSDFKITVQQDGCVTLHYDSQDRQVDWIFDQRERKHKGASK